MLQMRVGIVDADFIGREKHRFPNLASMKLSSYYKGLGYCVDLITDYNYLYYSLGDYDKVFVSKVFTDTESPDWLLCRNNIFVGGTGFFFDSADPLPYEIEHCKPDYGLYDKYISDEICRESFRCSLNGTKFDEEKFLSQFKYYREYSIGFLTRGCFRKCPFCVNQKYSSVQKHSPLKEFYDSSRKKLLFLDDNFLGFSGWEESLEEVVSMNVPYTFKQGLDERLLTDKKCEVLFGSRYDGDFIFAFDNVDDYDLVERKLRLIREHTNSRNIKFYVLVGFNSVDEKDIESVFKRVSLLMKYRCLAYIMRYQSKDCKPYLSSKFKDMYITLARWCNMPSFYTKMSFKEFCYANQDFKKDKGNDCVAMRCLKYFEANHKDISDRYFDLKFGD